MGILAGVTVALVVVASLTRITAVWALAIAVPIALAVWYLYGYHRSSVPVPTERSAPDEPFDDPVEAADREASARAQARADAEDDEVERLATAPVPPPEDELGSG